MKGISPMISVVLLLAFTVAVGGILSVWLSGFTRTAAAGVESTATNQTKCAGTYIDVVSVTSNAITLTNRGSQTISVIQCFAGDGSNITGVATASLAAGASTAGTWTRGTNTSVVCSGQCLNIGVTGDCESGESCWK